jgi:hypothetical protein
MPTLRPAVLVRKRGVFPARVLPANTATWTLARIITSGLLIWSEDATPR